MWCVWISFASITDSCSSATFLWLIETFWGDWPECKREKHIAWPLMWIFARPLAILLKMAPINLSNRQVFVWVVKIKSPEADTSNLGSHSGRRNRFSLQKQTYVNKTVLPLLCIPAFALVRGVCRPAAGRASPRRAHTVHPRTTHQSGSDSPTLHLCVPLCHEARSCLFTQKPTGPRWLPSRR